MSNRRWVAAVLASIALLLVLNLGLTAAIDPYGIFRNPQGRSLPLYYADRTGKFYLNTRYVPSNFNALIIGPSSSVNWDTERIAQGTGLHLYNESLEGGNATEQRLLTERALAHGRFKVALLVIYPTMTSSHKVEEGLNKADWTGTLGSLDQYIQMTIGLLLRLHLPVSDHGATGEGSHAMRNPHGIDPATKIDFHQDAQGLQDLLDLTAALHRNGTRVICVIPPIYQPVYAGNAGGLEAYRSKMMQALPDATWIDLDGPEYAALRSDPANYIDDFHVTPVGAEKISGLLNARLQQVLR